MAIKSMIRLNQIKEQQIDFAASANLQSAYSHGGEGKNGLEETLSKLGESLHKRFGTGGVGTSGLHEDNTAGVLASFSDADAIEDVKILQAYDNASARLLLQTTGAASKIELNAADLMTLQSVDTMVLYSTTGGIDVDSDVGNITIDGSRSGGAQSVIIGQHDGANPAAVKLQFDSTGTAAGSLAKLINQAGTTTGSDTGGAIFLEATAGGIGQKWSDSAAMWSEGGTIRMVANENAANAIKLHADGSGTDQTIVLENTAGNGNSAIHLNAAAGKIDLDANAGYTLDVTSGGATETITAGGSTRTVAAGNVGFLASDTDAVQQMYFHVAQNADADALRFVMDGTYDGSGSTQEDSKISLINDAGIKAGAITIDASVGQLSISGGADISGSEISSSYDDFSTIVPSLYMLGDAGSFVGAGLDLVVFGASAMTPPTTADLVPADAFAYSGMNIKLDMETNNGNNKNQLILGDGFADGLYDSTGANSRVWSASGIPLSMASDEWYQFGQTFGEVSLLNAIVQAGAGQADAGRFHLSVTGTIAADAYVLVEGGTGNEYANAGLHANVKLYSIVPDFDDAVSSAVFIPVAANTNKSELFDRLSVFVNGQRMLADYYDTDAGNGNSNAGMISNDFAIELVESDGSNVTADPLDARQVLPAKLLIKFHFQLEAGDKIEIIME